MRSATLFKNTLTIESELTKQKRAHRKYIHLLVAQSSTDVNTKLKSLKCTVNDAAKVLNAQ